MATEDTLDGSERFISQGQARINLRTVIQFDIEKSSKFPDLTPRNCQMIFEQNRELILKETMLW